MLYKLAIFVKKYRYEDIIGKNTNGFQAGFGASGKASSAGKAGT